MRRGGRGGVEEGGGEEGGEGVVEGGGERVVVDGGWARWVEEHIVEEKRGEVVQGMEELGKGLRR